MNRTSRNYGIDLMRVISILGVVCLHVLGHGGILYSAHSPINFSAMWFLELLCYPAVNCFVLISGFVGYRGMRWFPKIKSIVSLFFVVLFYSVGITVLFKVLFPASVGTGALVKSFFPVLTTQYWFFTAYVGMFLLSPILNMCVQAMRARHACIVLATVAGLGAFSLWNDAFSLLKGYSVIWFGLMYLTGAILKKFDVASLVSKRGWLAVSITAFMITWLSKVSFHFINIPFLNSRDEIFVAYSSPTVMLAAIGLVCLFSKVTVKPSLFKTVEFFAVSSFSVYLIHDNVFVRKYVISHIVEWIGGFNTLVVLLCVTGIVVGIFMICTVIDKLRIGLFRVARLDRLAEWIETVVKAGFDRVYVAALSLRNTKRNTK